MRRQFFKAVFQVVFFYPEKEDISYTAKGEIKEGNEAVRRVCDIYKSRTIGRIA